MKNLFTLSILVCFSIGMATAQNKVSSKPEKVNKVESKDALKKAQVQSKKMDAETFKSKRAAGIRFDANNPKKIVLTKEQRNAIMKAREAKTTSVVKAD